MAASVFVVFLVLPQAASAGENELARWNAYFRCCGGDWQKATVDNATVGVGEPFDVKFEIYPKKTLSIDIAISASGFRGSVQPFEVIEGSSGKHPYCITRLSKDGVIEPLTLSWRFKPTEVWKGVQHLLT